MPNTQFHTAISTKRFNRYLAACNNSRPKARQLYRANLRLSQKMYSIIGMFEVILRNSIDRHFKSILGPNWLEHAVNPNGFLDTTGCEDSFHNIQDGIHRLGLAYTHDGLISRLTFGFWAYQFSKNVYAAAGNTLLQIFSNKPHGLHQKEVFKNLVGINETRNRIAHYEPICFDKSGNISSFPMQGRYDLIIEMLGWLGCPQRKILYGIDGVQNAIDEIKVFAIARKISPRGLV